MAENIKIKKTKIGDEIYICQSDILILMSKMKSTSMSSAGRLELQNLMEIISKAKHEVIT